MTKTLNAAQAAMLTGYSKEIMPMFEAISKKANILKDFRDTDEKAMELADMIKQAQDNLKKYLEEDEHYQEITAEKKELEKELKLAIKALVTKIPEYKPAVLKKFFKSRLKEDAVKEVIDTGDIFSALDEALK